MELVEAWYAGWIGSPEAMRGLGDGTLALPDWLDEGIVVDNLDEIPGHFEGHEGVRRWARESFAIIDDGFLELQELTPVHEDAVVSVGLVRGRMKETGLDPRFPLSSAHGCSEGRLVYGRGFSNREEAIEFARAWRPQVHHT